MLSSDSGKAILFVKKLLKTLDELGTGDQTQGIQALATDDLVVLTERMLEAQDKFIQSGKPYYVDIGFHITRKENIDRIGRDGLLTKKDRRERHIISRDNGAFLGDGIYTSENPHSGTETVGHAQRVTNELPVDGSLEPFRQQHQPIPPSCTQRLAQGRPPWRAPHPRHEEADLRRPLLPCHAHAMMGLRQDA